MKVGVIGHSKSAHEARFLRAFAQRGIEAIFMDFEELSRLPFPSVKLGEHYGIDFVFGGPLHARSGLGDTLKGTPYVAVSYAFDVLYKAKHPEAAINIRKLLDRCCGLVVDCAAVENAARERFDFRGPILNRAWGLERVSTSAVLDSSLAVLPPKPSDSEFSIVSVRNFTDLHGVPDIVRAFSKARERNENLHLLMAGDGPLKAEIRSLIDSLALARHVTFLGHLPESAILTLLQRSDLYISASYVDGTSISMLQALDAGLPVLLSDVGGNPEWSGRTEGALLFEPGNWEQLSDLILIEAAREYRKLFDRGEMLAKYATWQQNADDIVDFCLEVIQSPHSGIPLPSKQTE